MPVIIKCEVCGRERKVGPSKSTMRFCSWACANKDRTKSVVQRFWARVKVGPSCWDWQGAKSNSGYGIINRGAAQGGVITTHTLVWTWAFGPIPEGMWILHKCDNKICVRPDHLFLGTPLDNTQDMIQKGRNARGERNGSAKLTTDNVIVIRESLKAGSSAREIAIEMDVHEVTIRDIAKGRSWRHVP